MRNFVKQYPIGNIQQKILNVKHLTRNITQKISQHPIRNFQLDILVSEGFKCFKGFSLYFSDFNTCIPCKSVYKLDQVCSLLAPKSRQDLMGRGHACPWKTDEK